MKLLLIDDDELDRQAIIRTFRKNELNIEVIQASSASEGLAEFNAHDFDAVLLDYRLPDIDGLEVLQLLTTHPNHHSAVIILTGENEDDALERKFIEAGAQDVLFKSEIGHKHITRAIVHARTRHLLERELQESHQRLRVLAENDSLTGLANRYYFDESLRSAIPRAKRLNDQLALLFLDLDNFKIINDSLGHATGDYILREVAQRLLRIVRTGDIVCRLGGDEFAILAFNIVSQESIAQLAQRILEDLRQPFFVSSVENSISVSIGIATYPHAADNASDMLRAADLAMYQAKHGGRNNYFFFSQALQAEMQERTRLEKELRAQVPTDHFILYYQPIVDAHTFEINGAEGLVRWNHPGAGVLPPSDFIRIAEEIGLITEIDSKSRLKACMQLAKWREKKLVSDDFKIKVNICSQLLSDDDLHLDIKKDLERSGVPGQCVGLEITESVMVENLERTSKLLQQIQEFGVEILVDDFGTGYSSMAYLKELPARTLKIDRIFVQGIPEKLDDCRILRAMIEFARSLNFRTIVEGVETREQARLCRDYGADQLQGFLFAQPLAQDEFEKFLQTYNPLEWVQQLSTTGSAVISNRIDAKQ